MGTEFVDTVNFCWWNKKNNEIGNLNLMNHNKQNIDEELKCEHYSNNSKNFRS